MMIVGKLFYKVSTLC